MSNFANRRKFRKKIITPPEVIPGQLGDGLGNLVYSGGNNLYYCRIAGQIQVVYNDRVPAQNDLLVDVGRDTVSGSEKPGIFKVLSTRSSSPGGMGNGIQLGYAPASRYQWMAIGGGQDVLWVDKRQITNLRIGPLTGSDMYIGIVPGIVYNGTNSISVAYQTASMAAHIPAGAGNAALVLITINLSGTMVATKGDEFVLASVADENAMLAYLPAAPAGTCFVTGAVRVYYGQTAVQETRTNTDIIDLRFSDFRQGVVKVPAVKTDNYTLTRKDQSVILTGTVAKTFTLPAAVGSGQEYHLYNESSANLSLAMDGTDTYKGVTSETLYPGEDLIVLDYASGKWC